MKTIVEIKKPRIATMDAPIEEDIECAIVTSAWNARDLVGASLAEAIRAAEERSASTDRPIRLVEDALFLMRGALSLLRALATEAPAKVPEKLLLLGERAAWTTNACLSNLHRAACYTQSVHAEDGKKNAQAWRVLRRQQETALAETHIWLAELAEAFPNVYE